MKKPCSAFRNAEIFIKLLNTTQRIYFYSCQKKKYIRNNLSESAENIFFLNYFFAKGEQERTHTKKRKKRNEQKPDLFNEYKHKSARKL